MIEQNLDFELRRRDRAYKICVFRDCAYIRS